MFVEGFEKEILDLITRIELACSINHDGGKEVLGSR